MSQHVRRDHGPDAKNFIAVISAVAGTILFIWAFHWIVMRSIRNATSESNVIRVSIQQMGSQVSLSGLFIQAPGSSTAQESVSPPEVHAEMDVAPPKYEEIVEDDDALPPAYREGQEEDLRNVERESFITTPELAHWEERRIEFDFGPELGGEARAALLVSRV